MREPARRAVSKIQDEHVFVTVLSRHVDNTSAVRRPLPFQFVRRIRAEAIPPVLPDIKAPQIPASSAPRGKQYRVAVRRNSAITAPKLIGRDTPKTKFLRARSAADAHHYRDA